MSEPVRVTMNPARGRRIAAVEHFFCRQRQEDPEWKFSRGGIPAVDGIVVRILSDDGRQGHGYALALPLLSDTLAGLAEAVDAMASHVIGRDPLDLGPILADLERAFDGHRHARSAIDFALHELAAVLLGVPLHTLLGGAFVRRLPMSRIVPLKSPEAMAGDAAVLAAKGYRGLKVKLDGNAAADIARVAAVRARVGERIRLSVDANQAYSAKGAIMTMRQLAPHGVDLVEQPVRADDREGLKLVRESLDMLVEADEAVRSPRDVMELAALGAIDSVNMKVPEFGGLRATLQAARICETAGIACRIGATFGPRLIAAQSLNLAACFRTHAYPHEIAEFDHLLDDPYSGLEVEAGDLVVSDRAGSGVEFDATRLAAAE